jgi:REP element-mobilizing transposase RayT
MPVRFQHDQNQNSFYFITFTCYKWLQLFDTASADDTVYKWFDHLYKSNIYVTGYVIMPNHIHVLLYFPNMPKPLTTVVGNAKRFMAYEIIKRLEERKENNLLDLLHGGVKKREAKKGPGT